MRKSLMLFLIILVSQLITLADVGKDCTDCNPFYGDGGLPLVSSSGPVATESLTVLKNRTYVVGYSNARMNPLWVCYRVYDVTQVGSAPSYSWRIDGRTNARVSRNDYTHTGFERGHMAPKSAMYHCYGWTAVYDSFLLSNASPQLKSFNGGIWKHLETLVRNDYSSSLGEVWVITGPIFDDSNGQQYLSKDVEHPCCQQKLVHIPDAFYKIIIDKLDGEVRVLALIIDHSEGYGYGQGDSIVERLSGFLVSIDQIEAATGLDFLSDLDDTLEDDLEKIPEEAMW